MPKTPHDFSKDLLGLRRVHRLREEFCLGENENLTSGPCDHYYGNKRCRLMETRNVPALRVAACTWSLLVMAVNAIWESRVPLAKEVTEQDVLKSLDKASLTPPTIEALYKLLETQAWRSALGDRLRRVCGNCSYYLPKSRTCDRDPDLQVSADSRCARPAFQSREQGADKKTCGNCRDFLHGKICERGSRISVNAKDWCKKKAFRYSSPEMKELTEIVHESVRKTEATLDTARILAVLRDNYLKARPASYERTRYQRLYELVLYLKEEECSIAGAVDHFSPVWGVTKATIRNYVKEIRLLLRIEKATKGADRMEERGQA